MARRVGIDGKHVEIAETVRGEDYRLAVGTPYGQLLVARVGSKTCGLAARCRDGEYIALVGEGYRLAIGRNACVTHPQRRFGDGKHAAGHKDTDCYDVFHVK